jgi:hypothetical protein
VPFDARPLTEPVDPHAAARFARELKQRAIPRSGAGTVGVVIAIVALAFVVVNIFFVLGAFILMFSVSGSGMLTLGSMLPVLIVLLIVGGVIAALIVARRRSRHRQYRLDRFARANGMAYLPRLNAPSLPGMIFGIGRDRSSGDLVRGEHPRFVEFANYRYTTGSGKSRTTHAWGYVAIRLDAPLPHIVLDALGNNSVFGSNLPVGFDRDQRLSLEGDFDRHFALYCPSGYEADALYLFTPDIMARFLDHVGELDVEIVDDWLFLYARRDLSTVDPATWAWLFSVVAALLDKLAQWGRWRDERLAASTLPHGLDAPDLPFAAPAAAPPPPGVAAPGRRLRRRVPWVAFVIGAVIFCWYLFTVVESFLP